MVWNKITTSIHEAGADPLRLSGPDGLTDPQRRCGIAVRTAALLAATVALLTLSRSERPRLVVYAVFGIYIAIAAIWVRGQYATSMKEQNLWSPRTLTSAVATVLSAIAFGFGVGTESGALFISGLVATFYFLGYTIMGLRHTPAPAHYHASVIGWAVTLGVLIIIAAGALIGAANSDKGVFRLMAVFAIAALVVPIPVSVLTSRLHQHLTDTGNGANRFDRWKRWAPFALAGGGCLLLIGAGVGRHRVPGHWMALTIIVIVALMFALASTTYADIAVIIAAIALLGITPAQTSSDRGDDGHPTLSAANDKVLVAFGDSYMSGEGAQTFHSNTDYDQDHCRRAPTAFAEIAGQFTPFNGFISFACSGARTFNVYRNDPTPKEKKNGDEPRRQYDDITTQLKAYDAAQKEDDFTPSLVLVGLGGNDAGFATIGAMCLAPGSCGHDEGSKNKDAEADQSNAVGLLLPNISRVEAQLAYTFAEFNETFVKTDEYPGTPVAVVGYPDPIYNGPDADCSQVPLSPDDRDFIQRLLRALNDAVRTAATRAGLLYVDQMENSLSKAHLQLCDPANDNRTGLNIIGLQSVPGEAGERFNPQRWYHNSLHPNERGHAAMLVAFKNWLARNPNPALPGPSLTETQAGDNLTRLNTPTEATTAPAIKCNIYKDGKTESCENAGYRWATSEVAKSLASGWWALIYLAVAVGAWLIAVTAFALRKLLR
jgi:lysophospholipase L1-like esterase